MASGCVTWLPSFPVSVRQTSSRSWISSVRRAGCSTARGTRTACPGASALRGEGRLGAGSLELGLSKPGGWAVRTAAFQNPLSLRRNYSRLPAPVCSPHWEQSLDDCIRGQYSLQPQPADPFPSHYPLKHHQQLSFLATSKSW